MSFMQSLGRQPNGAALPLSIPEIPTNSPPARSSLDHGKPKLQFN
jgi:hypothetical protein